MPKIPSRRRLAETAQSALRYFKSPGGPFFIALLVLAGAATWFAAQSASNFRQAHEWSSESKAWQKRAGESERMLRRSEADVAALEQRQIDLAEEKADSEDQIQLADLARDKAIIAGAYQARCAEALLRLVREPDAKLTRSSRALTLAYCDQARELWQKNGEPAQASDSKKKGAGK